MKTHCVLKLASLMVCCLALFYLAEPSDFYRNMLPKDPFVPKMIMRWRFLLLLLPIPWLLVLLRFKRRNSFEAAPIYSASITLAIVVLTFTVVIALFYVPFHKIASNVGEPEVENVGGPQITKPEKSARP